MVDRQNQSHRTHSTQSRHSNHSAAANGESHDQHSDGPNVETSVTRLLVSIKRLLESLTSWSQQKVSEDFVSDVYVEFGNNFNAAVLAFGVYNIDMEELLAVPEDLRNVLEQCLAEEATPENLEIYLPTVRSIITNLLQGLRGKQSTYRRITETHKPEGQERTDVKVHRSSRREASHRSTRTMAEGERPDSMSRRTASHRREPAAQPAISKMDEPFVGGFSPSMGSGARSLPTITDESPASFTELHHNNLTPVFQIIGQLSDRTTTPPPQTNPSGGNDFVPTSPPVVPASVKRFSLVDGPVPPPAPPPPPPPPTVVVELSTPTSPPMRDGPASPPPDTLSIEPPPAVANSLAALKGDVLERRASKRFSTYNIARITGGSSRERSTRGSNRRSQAVGAALTPGDLAALVEADEEDAAGSHPAVGRKDSGRNRRSASRGPTPELRKPTPPPVPPLPPTSRTPEPTVSATATSITPTAGLQPPDEELSKIIVYLQLGREVKKAIVEPGLSFASLRMLFVDKFSYNPGLGDFPAIYIRDPSSGVQYELEDISEVRHGCLLSLNIEPLDQIKQHIDTQIASLLGELKDLKTAVSNQARVLSPLPPSIVDLPLAESVTAQQRPSDKHFQTVARRLSRFVANAPSPLSLESTPPFSLQSLQPQFTGQSLQPQMTGGSVLSDYSGRIVSDLKTQFDEVQNLRRDLGIMRQLYTNFMKDTKGSLETLRNQTKLVKQVANSSVGGARQYIDTGKKKLDIRSQNILTEVEKLQDSVEGIKDDVVKRQITPKPHYLKNIKNDMDNVAKELKSLEEHMANIKPMWKKTWEEELQNIVEEQQFLHHQEEFLADLLEDHKAVVAVYGHVEKIISLRGNSHRPARTRGQRPSQPEEKTGNTLQNVLLEIRGSNTDPRRRLEAIERSQEARAKEKTSQTDELKSELTDFVGGKKLKLTGGAEEVERVRQKKDEQNFKMMFRPPEAVAAAAGLVPIQMQYTGSTQAGSDTLYDGSSSGGQ